MPHTSAWAPGRVELLGNHTDYNDGFVLSAAIDYGIAAAGELTGGQEVELHSSAFPEVVRAPLSRLEPQAEDASWANYPLGVIDQLIRAGHQVPGLRLRVETTLPAGAGLASSAALEVATGLVVLKLVGQTMDRLELAKLCRRAENEFVGVNCGLLDQVSSLFGRERHAIFLDCRYDRVANVPFPGDVVLLITHTGAPHRLTGGEYNERREQCHAAAAALGLPALRDASSAQVEGAGALTPLQRRRALHVTGENERVRQGLQLLRSGDLDGFGGLMFASHHSSQKHFENSTPELDLLVGLAREAGVLGARLTGGGFGGAIVSLVPAARVEDIREKLERRYSEQTGNTGRSWVCRISDRAA
jgi:galactokinase